MRGALRFAPLLLLFGLEAAAAPAGGTPLAGAPPELPELSELDLIRVRKAARIMELYADGRLVRVIRHVQLGDRPAGPKRFEGDERTPEGRYVIDWGNPASAYHLSLHISYPGPADRAFAAARGRSAGGMIMIHGQPNGGRAGARVPGDWTDGCIAVSDAEIEALWDAVPVGTAIEILP